MYDNENAGNRKPTIEEVGQKQYYADAAKDCCTAESPRQHGGTLGGRERTIAESMAFRADREQENAERSRKAARILLEHPEFEDFIWLLRSGQI